MCAFSFNGAMRLCVCSYFICCFLLIFHTPVIIHFYAVLSTCCCFFCVHIFYVALHVRLEEMNERVCVRIGVSTWIHENILKSCRLFFGFAWSFIWNIEVASTWSEPHFFIFIFWILSSTLLLPFAANAFAFAVQLKKKHVAENVKLFVCIK